MALSTFDTLQFVRTLEQAGVSTEQAEAQAEVLTEAFNVNMESPVTKDYLESQLTARFAELKADFDVKFRVLTVMVGIVMAAVVLPLFGRITAF